MQQWGIWRRSTVVVVVVVVVVLVWCGIGRSEGLIRDKLATYRIHSFRLASFSLFHSIPLARCDFPVFFSPPTLPSHRYSPQPTPDSPPSPYKPTHTPLSTTSATPNPSPLPPVSFPTYPYLPNHQPRGHSSLPLLLLLLASSFPSSPSPPPPPHH